MADTDWDTLAMMADLGLSRREAVMAPNADNTGRMLSAAHEAQQRESAARVNAEQRERLERAIASAPTAEQAQKLASWNDSAYVTADPLAAQMTDRYGGQGYRSALQARAGQIARAEAYPRQRGDERALFLQGRERRARMPPSAAPGRRAALNETPRVLASPLPSTRFMTAYHGPPNASPRVGTPTAARASSRSSVSSLGQHGSAHSASSGPPQAVVPPGAGPNGEVLFGQLVPQAGSLQENMARMRDFCYIAVSGPASDAYQQRHPERAPFLLAARKALLHLARRLAQLPESHADIETFLSRYGQYDGFGDVIREAREAHNAATQDDSAPPNDQSPRTPMPTLIDPAPEPVATIVYAQPKSTTEAVEQPEPEAEAAVEQEQEPEPESKSDSESEAETESASIDTAQEPAGGITVTREVTVFSEPAFESHISASGLLILHLYNTDGAYIGNEQVNIDTPACVSIDITVRDSTVDPLSLVVDPSGIILGLRRLAERGLAHERRRQQMAELGQGQATEPQQGLLA